MLLNVEKVQEEVEKAQIRVILKEKRVLEFNI